MINYDPARNTDGSTLLEEGAHQNSKPKMTLNPMSPLAASATVINLILATGPFSYPYAYTSLGPVISAPLLFIVAILAYMTAMYLVETISIATALKNSEDA